MKQSGAVRLLTLAALLAAGCQDRSAREASVPAAVPPATIALGGEQAERVKALGYTAAQSAPHAGAPAGANAVQPAGLEAMAAARKLIRSGQLTLTVASYPKAAEEAKRIAEASGGYLADAQATRGEQGRQHGTLTLRVAAASFDSAVVALRGLGEVRQESVGTQDVTKAYTDLETRLRVKRETADRLRALLRERTASLSDVLTAERELARVTEEIEQMEGERRFYDQQVALSTLTVVLQEPSAIVEAGILTPFQGVLSDALRALVGSAAVLLFVVLVLAPWALVAWLLWRVIRRVRARRAAAAIKA